MSAPNNNDDYRNKLDNLFEVALVLTGVLAAALFQYITALPVDSSVQTIILNFTLGFTTFPFIFLILIWILKEVLIIRGKRLLSLRLTFLCWTIWGDILFIYLASLFGVIGFSDYYTIGLFLVATLPVIMVIYGYKNTAQSSQEIEYFKSNKWKIEIALLMILMLVILAIFFFEYFISLF